MADYEDGSIPDIYVDSVQVNVNPVTFTFEMGRAFRPGIDPESQHNRSKVEAIVAMSPQHAKLFSLLLVKMIEEYESQHGKLWEIEVDLSKLEDTRQMEAENDGN